jgi:hypothetical protein
VLPPLCVKCNRPAKGDPIPHRLRWHPPALYVLVLAGVLLYAIIATIVQKHATIAVSLCEKHRRRRLTLGAVAIALSLGGLALLVWAASRQQAWLALGSIGVFLTGVVLGVVNRTITPKRIDEHYVWVGGCCGPFLANFPPVAG